MASAPVTQKRSWLAETIFLGKTPKEYLKSLITPWNAVFAAILAVGLPLLVIRFVVGIGATTNLTDQYPWGLWIGLDVTSGVALAAGGFCMAAAVYIFGMEEYRPIVRPAILTGMLGYLFVVIGLIADLGRPWNLYVPVVSSWGVTSVLFEVAWCVIMYLTVLILEFSPAVFEWLGWKRARAWALRMSMALIVFGIVLSTLHQSSLGSLFLIAKGKIHPLWYTPYLPILFFVSAVCVGISMVIFESSLSHRIFKDQHDPSKHVDMDKLTLGLGKAGALIFFAYFFGKIITNIDSGGFSYLNSGWGAWWLVEMLGFIALPCALYAFGVRWRNVTMVRIGGALGVLGVVLNRFNLSFIVYRWDAADRYVPSWMEWAVSLTFITLFIIVFRWIVNRMPVLRTHPGFASAH